MLHKHIPKCVLHYGHSREIVYIHSPSAQLEAKNGFVIQLSDETSQS